MIREKLDGAVSDLTVRAVKTGLQTFTAIVGTSGIVDSGIEAIEALLLSAVAAFISLLQNWVKRAETNLS